MHKRKKCTNFAKKMKAVCPMFQVKNHEFLWHFLSGWLTHLHLGLECEVARENSKFS